MASDIQTAQTKTGNSQSKRALNSAIRNYRKSHEREIVDELIGFLSIPNIETDRPEMRRNAEHLKQMLERRGVSVRLFDTETNPLVWGELKVPGATQTLTFYSHYDGVPVEPADWIDSHPYQPVMRPSKLDPATGEPKPVPLPAPGTPFDEEARIYARSASDDKGPIIAMLSALDAILASGIPLRNNLRFVFEGEEESGSEHFPEFVRKNPDLFASDAFYICDGPAYYTGVPTVWFGARGNIFAHVTVYGADVVLHAGHFTNFAPNPVERLSHLLASMTEADGRVKLPGFYDTTDPLSEVELAALASVPRMEAELAHLYGFAGALRNDINYVEALQAPGFNVAGFQGGWAGDEARFVVPAEATASIMLMPVAGCTPDAMVSNLKEHIAAQGYHIVTEDPTPNEKSQYPLLAKLSTYWSAPASRTPMNLPISCRIIDSLTDASDKDALFIPSIGSAIGILSVLRDELGIPTVLVSTVNPDNFQHGPNENLRLGNLWTGIETFAALMMIDSDSPPEM